MALKLEIDTDNAAFGDGDLMMFCAEAGRIFGEITQKLNDGSGFSLNAPNPIRDINGNRVGYWEVTQD